MGGCGGGVGVAPSTVGCMSVVSCGGEVGVAPSTVGCVSVVACGGGVGVDTCPLGANPWACTTCLWIGFAGWLFGGITLLGPPAISFREDFFVP